MSENKKYFIAATILVILAWMVVSGTKRINDQIERDRNIEMEIQYLKQHSLKE